jgi:hypothetical protein
MTQQSELGKSINPERQSTNLLSQIKTDVSNTIRAFPDINQEKLIKDFNNGLVEYKKFALEDLYPGKKAYETMSAIRGSEFIFLPQKKKVDAFIQLDKLDDDKKNDLATQAVTKLYDSYLNSKKPLSSEAWEKFVKAYRTFNAYCHSDGRFRAHYPNIFFYETQGVSLPATVEINPQVWPPLTEKDYLENTQLQKKLAETVGIIKPDDDWSELIHRKNIKIVDFGYRENDSDKNLILGELRTDFQSNFSLGGMPQCYSNLPTKYPDVKAIMIFDKPSYEKKYNEKLDLLIQKGILTPRVILCVPAAEFAE